MRVYSLFKVLKWGYIFSYAMKVNQNITKWWNVNWDLAAANGGLLFILYRLNVTKKYIILIKVQFNIFYFISVSNGKQRRPFLYTYIYWIQIMMMM